MTAKPAKRLTSKAIERAIKEKFGYDVILVRGDGYFWFTEEDDSHRMDMWESTSVMVYRLNQLTLDQWLVEFEYLLKHNEKN